MAPQQASDPPPPPWRDRKILAKHLRAKVTDGQLLEIAGALVTKPIESQVQKVSSRRWVLPISSDVLTHFGFKPGDKVRIVLLKGDDDE